MAQTNRRQKKTESPRPPAAAPLTAEPVIPIEPVEEDHGQAGAEDTVITEVEPAPGPGTGGRGRPPKRPPGAPSFFERLKDYPTQEWDGGQVVLTLYRLEPFTDRTTGGPKPVWVMKYGNPIDEERILLDHGSGRYRVYLNEAEPGSRKTRMVETHEFEIYNPKHPPKIPAGEWVEDPRNKKWAWAHPNRQRPDSPLGVADIIELVREAIRSQRSEPPRAETNDAVIKLALEQSQGRDTLARELASRPATPATVANPLADLKMLADVVMTLQPEKPAAIDPVSALNRAVELVKQLQPAAPTQPQKSPIEQVTEMLDFYEKLKGNFAPGVAPDGSGNLGAVAAIIHEVSEVLKNPLTILAQVWAASKARTAPGVQPAAPEPVGQPGAPAQQPPRPANGQPQRQQPQADTQGFLQFVETITPTMIAKLESGEDGGDFAAWIYEGWPDVLARLQTLATPAMPGVTGAPVIIGFYRTTPHWPRLALHEKEFGQFIDEFCKWKPQDLKAEDEIKEGDPGPDDDKPERMEV